MLGLGLQYQKTCRTNGGGPERYKQCAPGDRHKHHVLAAEYLCFSPFHHFHCLVAKTTQENPAIRYLILNNLMKICKDSKAPSILNLILSNLILLSIGVVDMFQDGFTRTRDSSSTVRTRPGTSTGVRAV